MKLLVPLNQYFLMCGLHHTYLLSFKLLVPLKLKTVCDVEIAPPPSPAKLLIKMLFLLKYIMHRFHHHELSQLGIMHHFGMKVMFSVNVRLPLRASGYVCHGLLLEQY